MFPFPHLHVSGIQEAENGTNRNGGANETENRSLFPWSANLPIYGDSYEWWPPYF
jgi:hypothetical protein